MPLVACLAGVTVIQASVKRCGRWSWFELLPRIRQVIIVPEREKRWAHAVHAHRDEMIVGDGTLTWLEFLTHAGLAEWYVAPIDV